MDLFSSHQPTLVAAKTSRKIRKKVLKGGIKNRAPDGYDRLKDGARGCYERFIRPNRQLLIVLALIGAFLYYRYQSVQKQTEEGFDDDVSLDDLIGCDSTSHLTQRRVVPTMNPLYPPQQNADYTRYPPGQVSLRTGPGLEYPDRFPNQLKQPHSYRAPAINVDSRDGTTVPELLRMSAMENPYAYAQPSQQVNPLGYSTDFNQETGDFVGFATDQNQAANAELTDYERIRNRNDRFCPDIGPAHLDDPWETKIEAPYADDF